ncbi:MAG: NTP transferase domain-containing protein [Dehalococcoidia bacterium]|nr:NTP transferase domain-containing protein [Dehalococcoidia bacterium]
MQQIKQAIILAAGEGQRLRPLTVLRPKSMLFIAGKPILQYVVESLVENGIRQMVIVVGYRKEQIQDYFASGQDFGAEINYVIQEQQLGTAHALKQAKGITDDRFIVLPGDNIIDADTILPLLEAESNTVLVKKTDDTDAPEQGLVIARSGTVQDIIEREAREIGGLVNTGIYTLGKDVFPFLEEELELPSALRKMIAQGYTITYQETPKRWLDVIYHSDILKSNNVVLHDLIPSLGGNIEIGSTIKGAVSIGKETIVRSNCYIVGPVSIGENCEIGPNVCILPSSSIGDNVIISPFTLINNCLVSGNVSIGSNSTIEDSVIASGSVIRGHLAAYSNEAVTSLKTPGVNRPRTGTIIGQNCRLEDSITIRSGVTIGNYCLINAMKTIAENIPDESVVM